MCVSGLRLPYGNIVRSSRFSKEIVIFYFTYLFIYLFLLFRDMEVPRLGV